MKGCLMLLLVVVTVALPSIPVNVFSNTLTLDPSPAVSNVQAWGTVYSGGGPEGWLTVNAAEQTTDGGYILTGDLGGAWVARLDPAGSILWQKSYRCAGGRAIHQAPDGGYVLASAFMTCLVRLDASGNVVWLKNYVSDGSDNLYSMTLTSDGGVLVSGIVSYWGNTSPDGYVMRTDASGNLLWRKTYGGLGWEAISNAQESSDGGIIAVGQTTSFGAGNFDGWILKLDANGDIIWQRSYGGPNLDRFFTLAQRADSGFTAIGDTVSFGAGSYDTWIVTLDKLGNVLWQRAYGTSGIETASSVQETSEGGLIVGEYVNGLAAFLRMNSKGDPIWERVWRDSATTTRAVTSLEKTSDNGFIASGWSQSFIPGGNPDDPYRLDGFAFRLGPGGVLPRCENLTPIDQEVTRTDGTTTNTSSTAIDTSVQVSETRHGWISYDVATNTPCPTFNRKSQTS